jgi:PhzF family phenazine biosynthesis protein
MLSREKMQTIAREFNYSETVFLHDQKEKGAQNDWAIDIFTLHREIPFAGHPTIGTACYLLGELSPGPEATLLAKAGRVDVAFDAESKMASVAVPHDVRIHRRSCSRKMLVNMHPELDSHQLVATGEEFPIVSIVKGMTWAIVELPSLHALSDLKGRAMTKVEDDHLDDTAWGPFVGCYFFVRCGTTENDELDLRTRMVTTSLEDPATGSAASALSAYLTIIDPASGRKHKKFRITQGVEMGRKSVIATEAVVSEHGQVESVRIRGRSVKILEGRLTVDH